MQVHKFNSESEADTAQEAVYQAWKASSPQQSEKYWTTTTRWSEVKKREDADEWFFSVCSGFELGYTVVEDAESWYPAIEEE